MPYYKYQCEDEACDHLTEFLCLATILDDGSVGHKMPEDTTCEKCRGPTHRKIEAPGLTRMTFDRNGKKGIEIRQEGGAKRVTSATREKYEHDIGNKNSKDLKGFRTESVYSKEVQKVMDKKKLESEKKK